MHEDDRRRPFVRFTLFLHALKLTFQPYNRRSLRARLNLTAGRGPGGALLRDFCVYYYGFTTLVLGL